MGLFTTQAEWKQKVETLTSELDESSKEVEALKLELAETKDDLSAAREALATAPTAEQVAKLEADLEAAQAAASEETITAKAVELVSADEPAEPVQKVIASRVTEALASAGHSEAIPDVETDRAERKEVTREEFNKMSPAAKSAFSRNGGRITG